ncbi:MAG: HAMP domain-containing histidine kinase [Cellvibrionaceae bacterium]
MNDENIDFSLVLASSIHDMKNSLGLLLSSVDEFTDEYEIEDGHQADMLATMRYEASRINRDLIHLLSIYRIRENQLAVSIDECNVLETIEDQLMLNEMLFRTKSIGAEIDCSPDLMWYYDNEFVGSILNNLIVNGVRYTKSKIRISAVHHDGGLLIEFADDGMGYPKNMIDTNNRVLDELGPVSFGSGSTALGLYFAQQIATHHRRGNKSGYVEMENGGELGGGIFRLYLP